MNILILNYPYFNKNNFAKLNIQTTSFGCYEECDIIVAEHKFNIEELTKHIPNIELFDAVIYIDSLDRHLIFKGVHKFSMPTIYYAVDSTINFFWQKNFSQLFDITFIDQPLMYNQFLPYANNLEVLLFGINQNQLESKITPLKNRDYDIIFVGRRNQITRPKREKILAEIKKLPYKIKIIDGETDKVTPQELEKLYKNSKIILNENLFPSLNLRLFEAGASRALLFNEELPNFLNSYFKDNQDYISYNKHNLKTKISFYLQNLDQSQKIADHFYTKITKYHTELKRIEQIVNAFTKYNHKNKVPTLKAQILECNTELILNYKWSSKLFQIGNFLKKIANYNLNNYLNIKIKPFALILFFNLTKQKAILTEYYQKHKNIILNDILLSKLCYWGLDDTSIKKEIITKISENLEMTTILDQIAHSKIDNNYYFTWALLLEKAKIEIIDFGFTIEKKPFFLYTQFDFFLKSYQENIYPEESLLSLITILEEANAYNEALTLYNQLFKLNNNLAFKLNDRYQNTKNKSF